MDAQFLAYLVGTRLSKADIEVVDGTIAPQFFAAVLVRKARYADFARCVGKSPVALLCTVADHPVLRLTTYAFHCDAVEDADGAALLKVTVLEPRITDCSKTKPEWFVVEQLAAMRSSESLSQS